MAFAPLFILWFGYNAWPKLIVTILVVFFPILVNVLQAMRVMDRDLVNLARAYNMSKAKIFFKIMLPFSMPNLLAGLRIGATLAVIGITVGELVGGEIGLGYLISFGQGQANTAMVFDAIGLLTVIGIVMYWAVTAIETPRAALCAARHRRHRRPQPHDVRGMADIAYLRREGRGGDCRSCCCTASAATRRASRR